VRAASKSSATREEAILPLPCTRELIEPARHFRSTWIVASHEALRHGGHFEKYCELLGAHREQLLSCVAGTWLPIEVASDHYRACDALELTPERHLAMTMGPGGQVRRSWYAPLIATAEQTDATPWSILPLLHRMWLRSADGGAAAVYRLGPNKARVEYVGCELFAIPYFRQATRTILLVLMGRMCKKPTVRTLVPPSSADAEYLIGWA
jgi:hypothetical protein